MWGDREDSDAFLVRSVTPEDPVGARGSVLHVGLKDGASGTERVRET